MSDVGASPPLTAAAGTAAAPSDLASLGEVELRRLPSRLTNLSRPVTLTGTVAGQTTDGDTRVRTSAGEVVIRTAAPPAADSSLVLQIGTGQPPTRATAFAGGQGGGATAAALAAAVQASLPLPEGAEAPPVTTILGTLARAALAAAGTAAPLQAGTVLPGQALPAAAGRDGPPPSAPGAPAGPPPPQLPAGTMVAVRVLGPAGAGAGAVPPSAPAMAESGGPDDRALPSMGAGDGAVAAAAMAGAGAEAAVEAAGGQTAGGGAVLSALARRLAVTGTITGALADGRPVLTTAAGSLALASPVPLPPGLRLAVELGLPRDLVPVPPDSRPTVTAAGGAPPLAALAETLNTLEGLEGALAHTLLPATLPHPDRKLAAALTFFLDRARRGDARGWLGEEAAEALDKAGKRGRAALDHLTEDFRTMARQAAEAAPGEWRSYMVPIAAEAAQLQGMAFFVRVQPVEDEPAPGAAPAERSHRFLLDLELSRLGALQLDGLVKTRRFDLILRSAEPLPGELRRDLLEAFGQCLGAVDFTGALSFQPGRRGWVHPPGPAARHGRDVIA